MKKMVLLMLAIIVVAHFSCGDTSRDPLAYQEGEIRAEIAILKNGCRIGAVLHITEEDDVSLTLISPESVKGTEIRRTNGEVTVNRGGLSSSADAYLSVSELFSLDGYISSSETAELDGKKLTKICVVSDGETYEVYISENNMPVRIVSKTLSVDVVWFQNE